MWDKPLKKALFTLNLNNSYSEAITSLTYPLLKEYARKIDAEFVVISERKFPDWLHVYEKFQIYELAQQMNNDWNIYFDCDALIHPDTPDITNLIPFDTVCHNAHDPAPMRWKYDRFFQRDGRHIGSCNWCTTASRYNIELWKPVDDLTQDEIASRIFPVVGETLAGVEPIRLIDDFVCSRNIAKYGLKYMDLQQIFKDNGMEKCDFFFHNYAIPNEEKVIQLQTTLRNWSLL